MSYDLTLFHPPPGHDPLIIAQARFASDEDEPNSAPPDPTWPACRTSAIAALQQIHPHLTTLGDPPHGLNSSEEDGIRIGLYDETASVSMAYWHTGHRAIEVWRRAWSYLGILQSVGQLVTYDSQLDKILDLDQDFGIVLDAYDSGLSKLLRVANVPASPLPPLNTGVSRRGGQRGQRRRGQRPRP